MHIYGIRHIPIINENDTVITDEIRFGDNDTLAALVTNLKTFLEEGAQAPCVSTIMGTNTRLLSAQLLSYLEYFTLFSYLSAAAAVTLLAD